MSGDLAGRHAVVVGGSSGLGQATALALAEAGARVIVTSRDPERARESAAALPGGGHRGVPLDLTATEHEPGGVEEFGSALASEPGIDILVLNGGGPPPARAVEIDAGDATEALRPLLLSQISIVRTVLPGMLGAGFGRIVAIGSSGVQQPIPSLALSNLARAALAAYLKSLAADVADRGVTVNMVLPGRIATGRVAALDAAKAASTGLSVDDVRTASQAGIPAGRYGDPAEFAAAVRFLASPSASYVTGEQLRVDGGMIGAY